MYSITCYIVFINSNILRFDIDIHTKNIQESPIEHQAICIFSLQWPLWYLCQL